MKTLEELTAAIIGPAVLTALTDLLRSRDPEFPAVETAYQKAVQALGIMLPPDMTPTLDDYLHANEQDIISRTVCAGYYGFRVNLEHFRHPIGVNFVHGDTADYTRDHIIGRFPVNEQAEVLYDAFFEALPEDCVPLCEPIDAYFTYLECDGPKLAHYAGYVITNEVLPWMEPGYRPDLVQTSTFAKETKDYLGFLPL